MDVDRNKGPAASAGGEQVRLPRLPPTASSPREIGQIRPPTPPPTARRPRPVLVPTAGAFTLLAFIIAVARTVLTHGQGLDSMSPPVAAVGTVLIIIAVLRQLKPRQLAASILVLNVTYWLYFVLIAVSLRS